MYPSHPSRGACMESFALLESRWRKTGRTPPGVRELKLGYFGQKSANAEVAPLPGCVN